MAKDQMGVRKGVPLVSSTTPSRYTKDAAGRLHLEVFGPRRNADDRLVSAPRVKI